jgi:F0F1-type ATP synthase assembly protein I
MKKWVPAFQFLGIGFYIAACIAGGTMIGWWLGGKRPLFIITGLVIGIILAFYGMYLMVRPLMNNKNDKHNQENG